ncbi:(5-formylfuran-3-yl)methyl phosphate synthase [Methanospirillum sp.]|uniref:(5-formylfuran-3-yl)methyl phosphate synthase n=1 Tax=Methanospirillum sp. TaxID=45200 RepID=UPI00298314AD|nr:(5-formylfuran-3-yl)methyl phosphate synthase [Methanospirillum sp.]
MQLLVSPATLEEAKKALLADIVDVKRPEEGSLGASFPWIIRAIKELSHKPVSAAIGDFDYKPGGAALTALGAAAAGADFVKVGLMFDGIEEAEMFINSVTRAVKETFPKKSVVIAAYSDWERLDTISPFDMAPLAKKAGADISMVDTGIKDGKSTFEFMDEACLGEFTELNRKLGIKTALAGSLKFEDIEVLKQINPDIIGVRGMVCGGDRRAVVQEELVLKAVNMVH